MYTADDATTWHVRADLVVVGGGAGALVAAIAAAHHGCRVIVHERTRDLGGSLAQGPGILAAAATRLQRVADVEDTIERFAEDIVARDPELSADRPRIVALCQAMTELVDWLGETNLTQLQFFPRFLGHGHRAPRLHMHASGTGAKIAEDLLRAASKGSHVTIRPASVVEDLWADATGAVVGVAARERRGPVNVAANRVLLACGGFGANADLVAEHLPDVAHLPYVGVPGDLGDGLRWGTACGAALYRLNTCWVSPFSAAPGGVTVPDRLVRDGGILVNQVGARFVDETAAPLVVGQRILAQPGKVAYLLFDERGYRTAREIDPHFARLVVPRFVRRGASVEDLARHFEIDTETLTATLASLGADAAGGPDPFGRPASPAALTPPFYAVRVATARKRTLGGLRVDAAARVLRADGTPIPHLYACGGVVADVSVPGTDGYPFAHETLSSMALGWVAGGTARPPEAAEG
jgi:fumarate reductase flavoprotein subunit